MLLCNLQRKSGQITNAIRSPTRQGVNLYTTLGQQTEAAGWTQAGGAHRHFPCKGGWTPKGLCLSHVSCDYSIC